LVDFWPKIVDFWRFFQKMRFHRGAMLTKKRS
jgi:hypothetical protein